MIASVSGPRPLPLLGNLTWLARDPLVFVTHLGRTYGDISRFWIGRKQLYFVNHPDLIKEVLLSQTFVRSPLTRRMMASFLGDGLFSQEGDLHHQQRRLMQPAFHQRRLATYGDLMVDATYATLATWQSGDTRDLVYEMMQLTFAIVARTLFSSDTSGEARTVGHALQQVQTAIDSQYELYTALPDWMPLVQGRAMRQAVATLQQVTGRIVAQRRAAGGDHGDLLSMLLQARDEDGSTLSDAQVRAQILSLLFAGHETTANTLCWTWYLLSRHPTVLERLSIEIDQVVGNRQVRSSDLPQLPYTEQVVREVLRLYPPAWWAERTPLNDVMIGRYKIPAGVPVVISVYVTQRDPRFFQASDQFDPDRFAPERSARIPRYGYLPFGAGAHVCIGNQFALMEARLVLAAMVQQVMLQPVQEQHPIPRPIVTLGMADAFPIRVQKRRPSSGPNE